MADFKQILHRNIQQIGLDTTPDQLRDIDLFRTELLRWNDMVNLTRITAPEDFAIKHVIDSLVLYKYLRIPMEAKVIDVGTGPGIPGLLMKICRPDLSLTLLESVRKKTDFLTYVSQRLGQGNIDIINDRAEKTAHDAGHREQYDVAVARAVSNLRVLSELCIPFVKVGGIFVAMKGTDSQPEIQEAYKAIDIMGGKLEKKWDYTIGEEMGRRLVVIRKVKSTPVKYPRKPGMPAKSPL